MFAGFITILMLVYVKVARKIYFWTILHDLKRFGLLHEILLVWFHENEMFWT